ncbi:MAG TPA: L-aspartate oxidase [Candidatus Obscuribacterales bacterium]
MVERCLPITSSTLMRQAPLTTDVLIIGSGLAGLLLACELIQSGLSVVLATKAKLSDSNTRFAQGGMAAVTSANPFDSPEAHLQDTIRSGAGLVLEEAARTIISQGAELVEKLGEYGVRFDRTVTGDYALALEGGHKQKRVLHSKDTTGKTISEALVARVMGAIDNEANGDRLTCVLEKARALQLIVQDERVVGAVVEREGAPQIILAPHVVLATGGIGQLFQRTTNPAVATGDGIVLALKAGATLVDMEFVQFHPTAFFKEDAPAFLVSEAVRGAGATLLDANGERFAFRFHPDGELATRDVVARSILATMKEQKLPNVWLDLRPIGADTLVKRFPSIVSTLQSFALDPTTTPVPVCPAAHYFMGGIATDLVGRTTVKGLYAIGECASTGLHGANRLASNSLLEAGVMALRLAQYIRSADLPQCRLSAREVRRIQLSLPVQPLVVAPELSDFRRAMYENAGIVRSASSLQHLQHQLYHGALQLTDCAAAFAEEANMLLLGRLIAEAAIRRKETRGAHCREDFPSADDIRYKRRLAVSRRGFQWTEVATTIMETGSQAAILAV